MLSQEQIKKIKKSVETFFEKMTISASILEILADGAVEGKKQISAVEEKITINIALKTDEPQILIGQQGQTLFDIQRLLRMVINKKLELATYLNIDINEYKKKKIEYLKDLAKTTADQVVLNKEDKSLSPMSSYERRIIHAELAQRSDVATESHGEGLDRHIIIRAK